MLLAVGCQLGQVLRTRLTAGKNILDALLLQAEVTAQISKGSMAGDKVFLFQLAEFFLIGNQQCLQLLIVFCGILAVEIGIGFVCGGQCFGNIFYLCLRAAQAQPGVRVILAMRSDFIGFCKADAVGSLGSFYDDELGIGGGLRCLLHPALHAGAVVNQDISLAQRLHSFSSRLKIMRLCAVGNQGSYMNFILSYGLSKFFHSIKGYHNLQLMVCSRCRLLAAAACQQIAEQQSANTKNNTELFHGLSSSFKHR